MGVGGCLWKLVIGLNFIQLNELFIILRLTSFIRLLIYPFPAFGVALLLSPPPSLLLSILVRLALYLTSFLMDGG